MKTLFPISIFLVPILPLQAAPPVDQLDELVVDAETGSPSLTQATPEEARERLAKTPGGTEVIAAERYLTGRAGTLADTFALSPGVFAQPRFGADEARLSIRGSGLQRTFHGRGIRVLQDGVPLNLADGGFDMQAIDPLAASHINVWRGAYALAYGSSTLGGAIKYVSHSGRTAPGYAMRVEAGSFDYLKARIAGGWTHDCRDVYLSFSHHSQEGFRDHAEQSTQRLFANFGWRPADHIESRLYITSVLTDSELPGNLTKAMLEDDPRQANPMNLTNDQKRDFELHRIASKTTIVNGPNTWEFTAAWTYKDLDHPIFQVTDQKSNDALLSAVFQHEGRLFGRDHLLRSGALILSGETIAASFANIGGSRGALLQRSRQRATNVEGFIESQLALGGGFTGIFGAAASYNTREVDRLFGTTAPYDRSYDDISPKIGLRWDGPGFQIFGNVSGSYEPPSFSESGTAVVANEAQTATTFEIGTRGSRGPVSWDVSLYHAEIEDELLLVQLPPPAPLGATGTINADETIHRGIEAGLAIDLLGRSWEETPDHRLVFRSAWTYGDFRFDGDPTYDDNRLAGLPPHVVRGELLWEHAAGWYAGPTFDWVPVKSYIDHRNTFAADPYALLGFKLGRRVSDGFSWFVEAKNLTDEHYAATHGVIENAGGTDQAQFLPGDGRSLFCGVEWHW